MQHSLWTGHCKESNPLSVNTTEKPVKKTLMKHLAKLATPGICRGSLKKTRTVSDRTLQLFESKHITGLHTGVNIWNLIKKTKNQKPQMQLILTHDFYFSNENTPFSFERTLSQLSGASNGKLKSLNHPYLVQTWTVLTNVGVFTFTETGGSACMIIKE